ncbi:MAG: hypothetical protein N2554_06220, partial [Fimbriimonadales bacterium]|nr:hypothetical protein [Fimbriimonadales bacterium]
MRFLIAPTAYKGTLSPIEATQVIAEVISSVAVSNVVGGDADATQGAFVGGDADATCDAHAVRS